MLEKVRESKIITLLLIIAVVYFFLQYLTPLFSPILVAMLFVTIFGPFLKKLQKLHIHRQLGAILLLVFGGGLLVVMVWVLFSWVVGSLPEWVGQLEALEQDLQQLIQKGSSIIGEVLGIDGEYLESTLLARLEEGMNYLQTEGAAGMLSGSLQYLKKLALLGGFIVTFIIAAVLLARDYDKIMNNLLDREEFHVLLEVICGVIRYIATFVRAQLVIMSAISLLAGVVLSVSGIRHGALWGLLAGLLDALPFIGTGIVMMPLAVAALFQGNYGSAVVCLVLYAACVFLRELLEPRLIGKRMGISPIAVLMAVYAGIQLFGLWGIIKGPLGFMMIYQSWQSLQKRDPNGYL
ncbi:MAG: AI-2E family transporter [Acetatifactor sp.]|nr:AI-2E family transporter [Acetatifactor sp.]